jgi:hypothetical protein
MDDKSRHVDGRPAQPAFASRSWFVHRRCESLSRSRRPCSYLRQRPGLPSTLQTQPINIRQLHVSMWSYLAHEIAYKDEDKGPVAALLATAIHCQSSRRNTPRRPVAVTGHATMTAAQQCSAVDANPDACRSPSLDAWRRRTTRRRDRGRRATHLRRCSFGSGACVSSPGVRRARSRMRPKGGASGPPDLHSTSRRDANTGRLPTPATQRCAIVILAHRGIFAVPAWEARRGTHSRHDVWQAAPSVRVSRRGGGDAPVDPRRAGARASVRPTQVCVAGPNPARSFARGDPPRGSRRKWGAAAATALAGGRAALRGWRATGRRPLPVPSRRACR